MTRNLTICLAITRGYTCDQVASIYNITGQRIKQITLWQAKKLGYKVDTLTELRTKYKYRIIDHIQLLLNAMEV